LRARFFAAYPFVSLRDSEMNSNLLRFLTLSGGELLRERVAFARSFPDAPLQVKRNSNDARSAYDLQTNESPHGEAFHRHDE
jgi:hypothetical protein